MLEHRLQHHLCYSLCGLAYAFQAMGAVLMLLGCSSFECLMAFIHQECDVCAIG